MFQRLEMEAYADLCEFVLSRDGWRCRNCETREHLHVHHIIFRSAGGDDTTANLITLCNSCHSGIHEDVDEEGQAGLEIVTPCNANEKVTFIWAKHWRP